MQVFETHEGILDFKNIKLKIPQKDTSEKDTTSPNTPIFFFFFCPKKKKRLFHMDLQFHREDDGKPKSFPMAGHSLDAQSYPSTFFVSPSRHNGTREKPPRYSYLNGGEKNWFMVPNNNLIDSWCGHCLFPRWCVDPSVFFSLLSWHSCRVWFLFKMFWKPVNFTGETKRHSSSCLENAVCASRCTYIIDFRFYFMCFQKILKVFCFAFCFAGVSSCQEDVWRNKFCKFSKVSLTMVWFLGDFLNVRVWSFSRKDCFLCGSAGYSRPQRMIYFYLGKSCWILNTKNWKNFFRMSPPKFFKTNCSFLVVDHFVQIVPVRTWTDWWIQHPKIFVLHFVQIVPVRTWTDWVDELRENRVFLNFFVEKPPSPNKRFFFCHQYLSTSPHREKWLNFIVYFSLLFDCELRFEQLFSESKPSILPRRIWTFHHLFATQTIHQKAATNN